MSFRFLGEILGVIVAVIAVACIEALGHQVYPIPEGLDLRDKDQLAQYVESLPVGALLFPLSAWIVGTAAGAGTAARISRHHPRLSGGVVTGLMLIATIGQLVSIPHPTWMTFSAILGIPAVGTAATAILQRPAIESTTQSPEQTESDSDTQDS